MGIFTFDPKAIEKLRKAMENWSERDALPTGDPIGDLDDSFKKDQQKYMETMKNQVLIKEGKNFDLGYSIELKEKYKPKCDCGIAKTYKNHTLKMHSTWCKLRKK